MTLNSWLVTRDSALSTRLHADAQGGSRLPLGVGLAAASEATMQTSHHRVPIRVHLSITGKDGLDSEVRSYFVRALHRLDVVVIADSEPMFDVSVVTLRSHDVRGAHIGFTLSVAVTSWIPNRFARVMLITPSTDTQRKQTADLVANEDVLVQHILQACGPNELESMAAAIAAQIDGSVFERGRRFIQMLNDEVKRRPSRGQLMKMHGAGPLPAGSAAPRTM